MEKFFPRGLPQILMQFLLLIDRAKGILKWILAWMEPLEINSHCLVLIAKITSAAIQYVF